jgi:hypothetical protein
MTTQPTQSALEFLKNHVKFMCFVPLRMLEIFERKNQRKDRQLYLPYAVRPLGCVLRDERETTLPKVR